MNHTSPLHVAATVKNPDLADVLLEYGANVYARNNQSRTPRDLIHETDIATKKIIDFHLTQSHIFVSEDEHIFEILGKLAANKISVIPVLNKEENYLGLITQEDLIRYYANTFSFKVTSLYHI